MELELTRTDEGSSKKGNVLELEMMRGVSTSPRSRCSRSSWASPSSREELGASEGWIRAPGS